MVSSAVGAASRGFEARTRYELAEEILALLRTDSARRLRRAQAQDSPDPAEVARLTKTRDWYRELRADIHRRDRQEIDAIISEYGPLARTAAGVAAC